MGEVEVIIARFGHSTIFVFILMCSRLMPSSSRMGGSSGSPSPSSVDEMLRTMPLRDVSTAGARPGAAPMCPLMWPESA